MKTTATTIAALAAFAATTFAQGGLTPPGAPSPTMKTLQQVEPRIDLATVAGDTWSEIVISQSGSYYLSVNLEVAKLSGIHVEAKDVCIDLNGFRIVRVSGSSGFGIYIDGGMDRATVRNGSIAGFDYGIYSVYSTAYASGLRFEKLTVTDCTSYGIYGGTGSRLVDCCTHGNAGVGIYVREGSCLEGCIAHDNQGMYGIHVDAGSTLIGCTAINNTGDGINAGTGSSLSNCSANDNKGQHGIHVGAGSSLSGCSAFSNDGWDTTSYGIHADNACTIIGCTARGNSNTNSPSSTTRGIGIYASSGATVMNCTVSDNQGDGIKVFADSSVVGNTCVNNGYGSGDGAGIHATYTRNRIDSNMVTVNDRGIDVDGSGNIIVRNSASGNSTDYSIESGNKVGTIQTSPVGAGAWDNFEF